MPAYCRPYASWVPKPAIDTDFPVRNTAQPSPPSWETMRALFRDAGWTLSGARGPIRIGPTLDADLPRVSTDGSCQ